MSVRFVALHCLTPGFVILSTRQSVTAPVATTYSKRIVHSRTSLDLDWASIRPLNGSKQDAFEELCTQLARASCPSGSQFIRKGRPDSGVEAHVVHLDGTEWAWQSKYFDTMKSSQWVQLDESVKTALAGHPNLTRFIVCVPLDLPDGRTGRSKSARQHWNERVAKWCGWAARAGMSVEFVWQGSHELLTELATPQHDGLVHFFFATRYLDDAWFQARLAEAHEAAGPRYTPELNVKLTVNDYFDAFGRTHEFYNGVRAKARRIRDRMRSHALSLTNDPDSTLTSKLEAAELTCNRVLDEFKVLSEDPVRHDPLGSLRDSLREALRCTGDLQSEYRRQREAVQENGSARAATRQDDDYHSYTLRELYSDLSDALSHVNQFRAATSGNLVILTGDAGSGKTHLLCDLAKQRLDKGRPTVVLMGQRFLETSDPWTQALQQLDLAGWSARDLVKALEVVAQRANSRVFFVIDAINEGAGRQLWPAHLLPFLERLKASPWICTIISVRSSYIEDILPESGTEDAIQLEHRGFESVEFDATRAFFEHFDIDLPSTPLLAPEFSNPLYLKTLCLGLQASGQSRLPRGFQGVVKAFDNYVAGVNKKAARDLDYDARSNPVAAALKDLAKRMVQSRRVWLSYTDAETIVNAHLPGRDYSRSLMAKLFGEGLLIEERVWSGAENKLVTVVQIAYERLSDYLCVESLLDLHLNAADPATTFKHGGPLDAETLRRKWPRPGFHEALHILVAERTGRELIALMPALTKEYFTPSVFLNSIVWRDPAAVTPQAVAYLRSLKASHTEDVIDTLVTLATIPEHPLNADFTDGLLRESSMAERDAWWTIGLHGLWARQSAVDRLIQWANHLWPHTEITDESAKLAAYIIAWLLPSSNRFLRDHATKALVRVLTWRPPVIEQLIERFCDVDDAYVAERTLAAVYGATMRTMDVEGVGAVADRTHSKMFAAGRPRPHLLLREYAQGIIKRAAYLRNEPNSASWPNIDPPYASDWPKIPTESEIDAIAPTWTADTSKTFSWGHHRIRSSVMDDDFGRYVIGTNSWSTNWLSLRLDEPQWMSLDLRVQHAMSTFTEVEREVWALFQGTAQSVSLERFGRRMKKHQATTDEHENEAAHSPSKAEQILRMVRSLLLDMLGKKRGAVVSPLMDAITNDSSMRFPPKFDLKLVQRYIVGRVFELGWTSERFEQFDRNIRESGRDAAKPERIGKKYQWIAYHEMLAFMADHYQYTAEPTSKEIGAAYRGSWQDRVRDIDPSNVMQPTIHDEGEAISPSVFWAPTDIRDWHGSAAAAAWAQITDDIPQPKDLLFSRDDSSQSEWVNLHTDIKWTMPKPVYEDAFKDGRREIWMHVDGALVRRADVSHLKRKETARKIVGRGVHGSDLHEIFLGEIGWAEASKYFNDPYYSHLGWAGDAGPDEIAAIAVSQGYGRERGGLDCSVMSETISVRVPTERMLELLKVEWSGISATYVNKAGTVVAFDPAASVSTPSAFLVRRENLQAVLQTHDLAVCWAIQGEKIDAEGSPDYHVNARRSFYGLIIWDGMKMIGRYSFDEMESSDEDV
ncbi:NACHT domain-containing protein [Burkholderia multivorans]|uniref:AVAST type 2 anti-phage system protein Avs2 n=1 Tax=Burkholderia multivorans TaxID=87883 RepID=UPI001906FFDE|nr:AVAST type 2 anti-phage system protein Avs2 [Burkholderia multivorans]MBJ9939654.1 NACHT domain-containing protein [Burkholderia multivorans]MBU9288545.1 NACHT domain-containing protein [Burkholderia multivorans]